MGRDEEKEESWASCKAARIPLSIHLTSSKEAYLAREGLFEMRELMRVKSWIGILIAR